MSENLTAKTVRGIKWSSASTFTNAAVQLGYSALMARMLGPKEFGLVAMSGLVLRFGSYFAQMGMSQALINKKDLSKEDIRVGFTSSFILGAFFFALAWVLAPLSVYIFKNDELTSVLRVSCLSLLLNGLSSTSTSLLRRRLEFKAMAIIEIASYIVGYVVIGLLLAYNGFGVWSLVYASLAQATLVTVISYLFARHSLLLFFNWAYYKPLFAFGSKMSLIQFVEFLGVNLDSILIGRFLGEVSLGLYNRATVVIQHPINMITMSVTKVLFPAFSRIQGETDRLRKTYLLAISFIAMLMLPICAGIAAASKEVIAIMLGPKWEAAIPILQILSVSIPFKILTHFSGVICDATANLKWKIILNIVYVPFLAVVCYFMSSYGIVGFSFAIFITTFTKNLVYTVIVKDILKFKYREILQAYTQGLFSAIITGACIYVVAWTLGNMNVPTLFILIAEIITGALSLLLSLFISPDKSLLLQLAEKAENNFAGKDSAVGNFINKAFRILLGKAYKAPVKP